MAAAGGDFMALARRPASSPSSGGGAGGGAGAGAGSGGGDDDDAGGSIAAAGQLATIIFTLRDRPNHEEMTPQQISKKTKVDIQSNTALLDLLRNNPKVHWDSVDDTYCYKANYTITSRAELLDLLAKTPEGLKVSEVADCYAGIEEDIEDCIHDCDLIAVKSSDGKGNVLYPRNTSLLSQLSGTVSVEHGGFTVTTSVDLRREIERGDAIIINGVSLRVSARTSSKTTQQAESIDSRSAGSVHSASSVLPHRVNESHAYLDEYTATELPLFQPYMGPTVTDVPAFKHGFANDIRSLWSGIVKDKMWPSDRHVLETQMREKGILTKAKKEKRPLDFDGRRGGMKRRRRRRRSTVRGGKGTLAHLEQGDLGKAIAASMAAMD